MKTFQQLQQDVLRYYDLADEESGSDVDLAKAAINAANQHRATEDNWQFMLSSKYTLSVVASTSEYILPHTNLAKFQYLYSTTNKRFASSVPVRQVPYVDIAFEDTTDTDTKYYELKGFSPVKAQPTSSDTLTVTSTDAEVNNPELYIEGEDSSGEQINETIGKDGTTTQTFAKVTYLAKTDDWVGTLTLATTGGTTLLVLTADETAKQYPVLRWLNIPQQAETFVYRFFRAPRVMTRNFDTPDIPFPQSQILVYDALLDLATYNELDSESVNIWRDKQQQLQQDLYTLKLDGNTIAGVGQYIVDPVSQI